MKKYLSLLFTTMWISANTQTVILQQDFETGALPSGWSRTQNTPSVGWEFGDNLGSSYFPISTHTKYAASNDDKHDDNSAAANLANTDRLITPSFNLVPFSGQSIGLYFEYIQPNVYGSTGYVEVSTNGGMSWTTLFQVTTSTIWRDTTVLLLSSYTSYSNLKLAFKHNDNNAWAEGFGIDNVLISTVPLNDAKALKINMTNYVLSGNNQVSAVIENKGASTITSLNCSYTINGGLPVTETFNGLNIPITSNAVVNFTTPANFQAQLYDVCVTVNQVNGVTDVILPNNQVCKLVSALISFPVKRPLIESFVGAWSQFTPDLYPNVTKALDSVPNAIPVFWHDSDSMSTQEQNQLNTEYGYNYPAVFVDRYAFPPLNDIVVARGETFTKTMQREDMGTPAEVTIVAQTWDSVTRQLAVTVKAEFLGAGVGEFRLNAYVIEDSVTGVGTGYNQVNYYNTVAGHPFYGLGNPIANFAHRHVVRYALGGAWGEANSVSGATNASSVFTKTFTVTLPNNYNLNRISLVGVLQAYNVDENKREIINANSKKFSFTNFNTGIAETTSDKVVVYPNPTNRSVVFVNAESNLPYTVYDITGRTVAQGQLQQGTNSIILSEAKGMYLLKVGNNTTKIVKQ